MRRIVDVLIATVGRPSLAQAVQSAFAQNYQDVRVIVAADANEGVVTDILLPYSNDLRLLRVRTPQHIGYGDGVKHWWLTTGRASPFVKFLDDDDWLSPVCVATMMRAMDSARALVTCATVCVYAPAGIALRARMISGALVKGQIGSCSALVRTDAAAGVPWPRRPDGDYEFLADMVKRQDKPVKEAFFALGLPLYFYNAYRTNAGRGYGA